MRAGEREPAQHRVDVRNAGKGFRIARQPLQQGVHQFAVAGCRGVEDDAAAFRRLLFGLRVVLERWQRPGVAVAQAEVGEAHRLAQACQHRRLFARLRRLPGVRGQHLAHARALQPHIPAAGDLRVVLAGSGAAGAALHAADQQALLRPRHGDVQQVPVLTLAQRRLGLEHRRARQAALAALAVRREMPRHGR
ncbi:hypothetical protein D9M70_515860 [compost metagenome]